jgi:acetyl esterase
MSGAPLRIARMLAIQVLMVALALSWEGAAGAEEASAQPSQVLVERDVQYAVVDGRPLLMNVFTPPGSGPFPAVEMIHGGGWAVGSKRDMTFLSTAVAEAGYVAFAIDYRLVPEACHPEQTDDARAAVAFVRQNAARFNVDPRSIGAFGTSAGGTLAAMVGALGDGPLDQGSRVGAVVTWSGALDLPSVLRDSPPMDVQQERITAYACLGGQDPTTADSRAKLDAASPISYLTADDPPMLVANAMEELMPLPQAEAFVRTLDRLCVANEVVTPATGHATDYGAEARPPTLSFLETYVRGPSLGTPAPRSVCPRGEEGGGMPVVSIVAIGLAGILAGLGGWWVLSRSRQGGAW